MVKGKKEEINKLLNSFKYSTNAIELNELKDSINTKFLELLDGKEIASYMKVVAETENTLDNYINTVENSTSNIVSKNSMEVAIEHLRGFLQFVILERQNEV